MGLPATLPIAAFVPLLPHPHPGSAGTQLLASALPEKALISLPVPLFCCSGSGHMNQQPELVLPGPINPREEDPLIPHSYVSCENPDRARRIQAVIDAAFPSWQNVDDR